jgi:hypothetical protein
MKKRSFLATVTTSTVLAGILMLSGCGGSSESSKLPTLGKDDNKAEGTAAVIADNNGNVNIEVPVVSQKGNKVAVATFRKVSKNGNECCTQSSDNCSVKVKQISACGIDASDSAFIDAKDHVLDLINQVGSRYDANTDMVVFGGILTVSGVGFNQATMSLSINMIECGSAFGKDGNPIQAGFSNEGHIVDVYVEDANGNGKWINNIRIQNGKILIPASQLTDIDLPATFTFYSIKDANKNNTTGITGGTGGY